jgi:hypothetical protein
VTSRALASFWKCYEQLPQEIQELADRKFALFKSNPRHPSLGFKKKGGVLSTLVAAIAPSPANGAGSTIGSGSARMRITTILNFNFGFSRAEH